jgi:transposase
VVMPNQAVETAALGAATERGRRPTVVAAPKAANPEISDRPRRRTFTAAEKARILKEADQAAGTGAVGALLRRHGIYSSSLSEWRRQRDAGTLGALTPVRRGPKLCPANPLNAELAGARRDIAQLRHRLQRAEAIIEVQKNLPTCWESRWCRSRQTAHPDRCPGRLPAGQRHGCCGLRRARLVTRQPASQLQTPVVAGHPDLPAQPTPRLVGAGPAGGA